MHASYPDYIVMFDQLIDDRVIWTPYTASRVSARAPLGLSTQCTRDWQYCYSRKFLVHDVFVEEYHVHRVRLQFSLRQEFSVRWGPRVPLNVHG